MSAQIPPLLEMIRQLIAIPTVSSVDPSTDQGNRALLDLLATWVEDLGFRVEILPVPGHPDKANLVATLGTGPGGLILAGHSDTVPYDAGCWSCDPFAVTIKDHRLYGLGTSDMKSFLALAVESARTLAGQDLRRPLVILATADEESTMSGARALRSAGRPLGRFAVLGEPTGLHPVRMHKGILMEVVKLYGRSGHSSNPALGVNALDGMHRVLGALMGWRKDLRERFREEQFPVPVPTLNFGHIHGGDSANRICPYCELHLDLRLLPGMDLRQVRAELQGVARQSVRGTPLRVEVEPLFEGIPAFCADAHSPLLAAAEELTAECPRAVGFGTEAPYLADLGVDVLVLGPGDIECAHQPDEFLRLERIEPTLRILSALVERFCR